MPNFQLHWLVALGALTRLEGPAKRGAAQYQTLAIELGRALRTAVQDVTTEADASTFGDVVIGMVQEWKEGVLKAGTPAARDKLHDMTCFSAYMLGACGPDFWMCPSEQAWYTGPKPNFAAQHFNLGHYNRTHAQFLRSIEGVAAAATREAADVEKSYFLGMATHIGADLVIHELVNVSAGAYNLLVEDVWRNEQNSLPFKIWNTHNKVEHYWDSYVRFRFLGDLGEVFRGKDLALGPGGPGSGAGYGYPLGATLLQLADRKPPLIRQALRAVLSRKVMRAWVEKPLVFPWLFCDRVLDPNGGIEPFIYSRVVNKKTGAYPRAVMYSGAIKEAEHFQMEDDSGGFSERKKLKYFSSEMNTPRKNPPLPPPDPYTGEQPYWPEYAYEGLDPKAWNYQPFGILPALDADPDRPRDGFIRRTGEHGLVHGLDAFYELTLLRPFAGKAVEIAGRLAAALDSAYTGGTSGKKAGKPSSADLGSLRHFWNLDTGLGLEVQAVPTDTPRDLVTRLDFVHVLDRRFQAGELGVTRPAAPAELRYLTGKAADAKDFGDLLDGRPFPPAAAAPEFATFAAVEESDAASFLNRIRLAAKRPPQLLEETLDEFFAQGAAAMARAAEIESQSITDVNEVRLQDVKHRLTIELRIAVPKIGDARGEPAMFLHCDDGLKVSKASTEETHKWMSGGTFGGPDGKLIDFCAADPRQSSTSGWDGEPSDGDNGLRYFSSRLLVNLESGKGFEGDGTGFQRVLKPGSWNNVVPYDASTRFYGRNFAISTGRRLVLHPTGSGNFDPVADFSYYSGPSPTEQVFFTLYPLVKTDQGVFDVFSKQPVTRKVFDDEIVKVAGVGWVKIVLLYVLHAAAGAAQLSLCFVDGEPVRVAVPRDG
jgi:hypothetical protein